MPARWIASGSRLPSGTISSTSATQILPQVAAGTLKLRAVLRNTRLPDGSAFHALTMARSATGVSVSVSVAVSLPGLLSAAPAGGRAQLSARGSLGATEQARLTQQAQMNAQAQQAKGDSMGQLFGGFGSMMGGKS